MKEGLRGVSSTIKDKLFRRPLQNVILAGLAIASIGMNACEDSTSFSDGTVISKEHHEKRIYITYLLIPSGKSFIYVPQYHTDPERWLVTLKHCDIIAPKPESKETPREDCKTEGFRVSNQEYDRIQIGQYLNFATPK